MVAKQLSIFLENKSGRLTEVTEVLAKENINLSALCIAENADFGILRGIVSDPDRAYKALKDNHFAVNVTDVVGISCPNVPGALAKVLGYLSAEGVFLFIRNFGMTIWLEWLLNICTHLLTTILQMW